MVSYSHTNFRPYIINKKRVKLNKERERGVKNKMHSALLNIKNKRAIALNTFYIEKSEVRQS